MKKFYTFLKNINSTYCKCSTVIGGKINANECYPSCWHGYWSCARFFGSFPDFPWSAPLAESAGPAARQARGLRRQRPPWQSLGSFCQKKKNQNAYSLTRRPRNGFFFFAGTAGTKGTIWGKRREQIKI